MSEVGRDPIRVGVLGMGAISQIVHLPILSERGDAQVVAVADTDIPKAETLASRFEVPKVLSDQELIRDENVQAAVICAPNHLHETLAIAAIEAGKHVLVERPLALTPEGVQRVLDAAEAAGRCLAVGMNHRFRPDAGALAAFVAGGELGEIYAVRASSLTRKTPTVRSTWRQSSEQGGGALMDLGVQILDLAFWLVGYPRITRVSAVLQRADDCVENAANLFAVADSGTVFTVEVSWSLFADADRHYARVMGTDGSGSMPPLEIQKQLGGRPMNVTPRQPTPRGGENPFTNAYRRLLDQFVRAAAGECDIPPPTEQVHLMEVMQAAYRSAELGQEVGLGEG
jgi:predicted dehydrogenase